ncbi:efflux RND transporter periplasmic adaptor subunit [Colwelliaceae bacterium 6441]
MAQNYELAQISVTPYEKSIKRVGKVAFKSTLNLSFKSSGYLKTLLVEEGDFFTQHQLLASLNTEELKAEKNSRYARLLQAKREVTRVKKLLALNLSSEQALDVVQTNLETIREAYRVAYYDLEKAELKAPFDGVVLSKLSELAEFQSPGKVVLEVAAIDKNMVVKVALTSNEISYVKLGQSVQVHLSGFGVTPGVISKIPVKSNTSGQQYLVEVLLDNLKAGVDVFADQLAQVVIHYSVDKYVYRVPISALIEMNAIGDAVLAIKTADDKLVYQSFGVLNLDSQYLYIRAQNSSEELEIVTHGWQQLNISE